MESKNPTFLTTAPIPIRIIHNKEWQTEKHLCNVVRYVERNPVRGNIVARAEDWPWSSARPKRDESTSIQLADWPFRKPQNWIDVVNAAPPEWEVEEIRAAVSRNWPLGDKGWQQITAAQLAMSLRKPGRPQTKPGLVFKIFKGGGENLEN